jgi:hypothetical protein
METFNKQEICLHILEELLHLRSVLYATNKIYTGCSTAISKTWNETLAAFIDAKFYNPVIAKYSKLYASETATFVALPLKLRGTSRMLLTSADRFLFFASENEAASALLWLGVGRIEARNRTNLEPVSIVKLQDPRISSEKIVYCQETHVLHDYTLFALVHLLHNSEMEILEEALPEISQAFLAASLNLTAYAFRRENKKVIESPPPVDAAARTWFYAMAKQQEIEEEVAKYEKYSAEVCQKSFVAIMEKYYLAAAFPLDPKTVPASIKNYSTLPYNGGRLFDLTIDLTAASRFPKKDRFISEGPSLEVGEVSGALLSGFPHAKGRDLAQGLIITYIVLMTTMTEAGLLEVEKTIPEAERQYLNYLNTMLSVKAAFAPQLLTTLL